MWLRKILQHLRFVSSNDLDIVASEQKTQELYVEATTNGKAPGKTCKIQILGDERAGKTSLRKKLMGERFDPEEPPTFGIDTRFCKVSEINESWRERIDTGSEYERVLSWVLANNLTKWRNSLESGEASRSTGTRLFRWLMTAAMLTLSLCGIVGIVLLSIAVSSFMTASSFSYLLVLLSTSSVFVLKKSDMYRVGAGLAIFVPLADVLFGISNTDSDEISISDWLLVLWLVSGSVFGFACGFGLRTGLAAGVLLTLTPTATDNPDANGISRWQDHTPFLVVVQIFLGLGCGLTFGLGTSTIIPSISKKMMNHTSKASKSVSNLAYIPVILSVLFSVCTKYATEIPLIAIGSLLGVGLIYGILIGRYFAAVLYPRVPRTFEMYCILTGFSMGITSGYLFGYRLPLLHEDGLGIIGAVLRVMPLVLTEIYRRYVTRSNPVPVKMVSHKLASNLTHLPVKLSLWDFAGQEFYYNTHHTFMASDAVYIVVFDLFKCTQPNLRTTELNRIKFWMSSVYQHAKSPLFLVGTHLDCIDNDDLVQIRKYLHSELFSRRYPFLENLVVNKALLFFCVDNSGKLEQSSSELTDDTATLREAIRRETEHAKPMKQEYPIRWRRFLDYVKTKPTRSSSTNPFEEPFISLFNLKDKTNEFGFSGAQETNEMLQFFNASGEILYDSVDSILRQFVILQPQFLVDIMEAIVALPDPNTLGKLKETGILDCRLAKELITQRVPLVSDETHQDIVLAMLEAKDLICKVNCQLADTSNSLKRHEDKSKEGVYVVPSMLHKGQPFPSVSIDWDIKYYLDFGTVLPDAFLFRLMARCSSHSELVSQSENQCVLFREGGLFTLGTQFFFMLRKQQPCPTQQLVEVSVKAVPESNPIDVLRYLHNIMETLRCRDFPRLQYHVGIMCPHPAPHSSCRIPEMWHIVHLCGNDDTSFPEEPRVRRLCQGRNIDVDIDASIPVNPRYTEEKPMVVNIEGNNNYVVIAGRNARVSVNRESKRPSDHNEGNVYEIIPDSGEIDVYISSSPRDEGWVQEHLVRYLTAPPHKLRSLYKSFRHTITSEPRDKHERDCYLSGISGSM